jgi:hypothetical protein
MLPRAVVAMKSGFAIFEYSKMKYKQHGLSFSGSIAGLLAFGIFVLTSLCLALRQLLPPHAQQTCCLVCPNAAPCCLVLATFEDAKSKYKQQGLSLSSSIAGPLALVFPNAVSRVQNDTRFDCFICEACRLLWIHRNCRFTALPLSQSL